MAFEDELTRALRAEDPGEAFTARVLARVKADAATRADIAPPTNGRVVSMSSRPDARRGSPVVSDASLTSSVSASHEVAKPGELPPEVAAPHRPRARWVWMATMAASLLVSAAGGAQWMKHRQEMAEGARARAEVLAALRLTSEKLSLVRNAVASSEETR